MTDYLDASIITASLLREPTSAAVDQLVMNSADDLALSDFGIAETSSAISRFLRMGGCGEDDARLMLQDLDVWPEQFARLHGVEPSDIQTAIAYVRRFELKLRAPDAIHAAICQRIGARLVTFDNNLAEAARKLGLKVHMPSMAN